MQKIGFVEQLSNESWNANSKNTNSGAINSIQDNYLSSDHHMSSEIVLSSVKDANHLQELPSNNRWSLVYTYAAAAAAAVLSAGVKVGAPLFLPPSVCCIHQLSFTSALLFLACLVFLPLYCFFGSRGSLLAPSICLIDIYVW